MSCLKTSMERNYLEHLAFSFARPAWEIQTETLAAFNENYSAYKLFGATLNAASKAALRQRLSRALSVVFETLQAQAADEYETCFLLELKKALSRLLAEELAWYEKQARSCIADLNGEEAWSNALKIRRDRYFFSKLPSAAVAELRHLAERELGGFRANAAAGRLKREDLQVNSGPTVSAIRTVLNREFKALGVLDAVSTLVGRKTRVVGLALELSVPLATWWKNAIPGLARAPKTLYTHLDESISYPKSIVYLSDVTAQNGPTGCNPGAYEAMQLNPLQEAIGRIVGTVGTQADSPLKDYYAKQYHQSVNSENFRQHFMRLPQCLRFNSHMGWDVLPDSELESQLVGRELKMIGPAGTFIAFDGARLLHRGGLVEQGERVALQVIFSDLTYAQLAANKVKRILSSWV